MADFLEVRHLRTGFKTEYGVKYAVDDVSFSVEKGETFCIVGESGCGKSMTSLSILRLLPKQTAKIYGGQILFEGENLLEKSDRDMQKIRGNRISMIFQEPMTSLNPVYTIGFQLMEVIRLHQRVDKAASRQMAVEMLEMVGIASPGQRMKEFPYQLSGGMRQRVMIAMALACRPALLIADEPTTALDVTIQAQVLELMCDLKRQLGMAIILITHDLGVVAEMAQRVLVMYAGKAVECADVGDLFKTPLHPYTQGLLQSIPRLDQQQDVLHIIPGIVPSLQNMPEGCRFCPRCQWAMPICRTESPDLMEMGGRHQVACWRYSQAEGRTGADG